MVEHPFHNMFLGDKDIDHLEPSTQRHGLLEKTPPQRLPSASLEVTLQVLLTNLCTAELEGIGSWSHFSFEEGSNIQLDY